MNGAIHRFFRTISSFSTTLASVVAASVSLGSSGAPQTAKTMVPKSPAKTIATTVEASREKRKRFDWGFSPSYSLRSDLAQQEEPKRYQHSIVMSLNGSWRVERSERDVWGANLDVGLHYSSLGREIEKTDDTPFDVLDVSVSTSRSFELGQWFGAEQGLLVFGSNAFPLSESSRYEGYRAVPSLGGVFTSSFNRVPITLKNGVTTSFVANTYSHSPTSGEVNPDASVAYSITGTYRLPIGFFAGLELSSKLQRYLDGTAKAGATNRQFIGWSSSRMTAALSHQNGQHVIDEKIEYWYVDQYRRIVSFRLALAF